MDIQVQLEEDFNSRTKKLRLLSQTRPIPRSPDGDNKLQFKKQTIVIKGKLVYKEQHSTLS